MHQVKINIFQAQQLQAALDALDGAFAREGRIGRRAGLPELRADEEVLTFGGRGLRQILPDTFAGFPFISIDLGCIEVDVASFKGGNAGGCASGTGADAEAEAGDLPFAGGQWDSAVESEGWY